MATIHVPRPSTQVMNPDRPINALLLAQVEHLQHAERRLPLRYRSEIYTHAIRTEREAARYIRQVTEAIHKAHADAAADRVKQTPATKDGSKTKGKANSKGRRRGKNR